MRPQSNTSDLPSSYDVKVHLHNQFVEHMKELKDDIIVSNCVEVRLHETILSNVFAVRSRQDINYWRRMTAHWIEVKDQKWKMRSEVIGFKGLSGAHSGENLGRYAVGLLDRVGIMSNKTSKVCHLYFLCDL